MKCPVCGKRAFDISKIPNESIEIQLKCPNCHKVVTIPCNTKSCLSDIQNGGKERVYRAVS